MKIITLDNGLRIALSKRDFVHSASVNFFIGAGSRFETEENSGISHFIEHMLFKGTSNMSELEIAEKMDEMGGQVNAYTTKEYTCVYAQALTSHIASVLSIISDMILNSSFEEEELNTERGVILEEIGMYEDSPEDLCSDLLYKNVYKQHGLGLGIAGTKKTVAALDRAKMLDYMSKYYTPERMTVSVCGAFDEKMVVQCIKDNFGALKNTGNPFGGDAPEFHGGFSKLTRKFEQTQIMLCFEGYEIGSKERYAAGVLGSILGGGASSRLTHRIRGQLGLAYSVGCYGVSHTGTGMFCVSAGTSHEYQEKFFRETLVILKSIRDEGVRDDELHRTKEQFKAGLLMGLESSAAYSAMMGRSLLLENKFTGEKEMTKAIDRLKSEDLQRVAKRVINFDRAALAVTGKPQPAAFYKRILKEMK